MMVGRRAGRQRGNGQGIDVLPARCMKLRIGLQSDLTCAIRASADFCASPISMSAMTTCTDRHGVLDIVPGAGILY